MNMLLMEKNTNTHAESAPPYVQHDERFAFPEACEERTIDHT